jgi:ADP-ribose pyrophosphatase YjhB (NUDIX family)
MRLIDILQDYEPMNMQEEYDKNQMLQFIRDNDNYLLRENQAAHFTASAWTVNKERTKTLMVYHNIYDSWSWTGGHADGNEDLCEVALKELREETGVSSAELISRAVFSLETLSVDGHMRKGVWVPGHLHFNLTFLAEADENESLAVKEDENSAVKWWGFEDVAKVSTEPWMVEYVYKKLIDRSIAR